MASAFQKCAFAPRPAFQADPCVKRRRGGRFPLPADRRRRARIARDPWAQGFTRRGWIELQGLLAEEKRAVERAEQHKSPSVQIALGNAAAAVSEVVEQLERTHDSTRMLRLTAMLQTANSASRMRAIIARAAEVEAYVDNYLREQQEDEEQAVIMLLMS